MCINVHTLGHPSLEKLCFISTDYKCDSVRQKSDFQSKCDMPIHNLVSILVKKKSQIKVYKNQDHGLHLELKILSV